MLAVSFWLPSQSVNSYDAGRDAGGRSVGFDERLKLLILKMWKGSPMTVDPPEFMAVSC